MVIQKTSHFAEVMKNLRKLTKTAVYVGIPAEKSSRDGGKINNAELLYIHTHGIRRKSMRDEMQSEMDKGRLYSEAFAMYLHEHGSPLWHSPPRPVIEPALAQNKKRIARQFESVYMAAQRGDEPGVRREMNRIGLLAQNIVRDWFVREENGWAPNSPKTIARKGSDNPLIDTGTLRKSITYVLREEDAHD